MQGRSQIVEDVFDFFENEEKEEVKEEKVVSPFDYIRSDRVSV